LQPDLHERVLSLVVRVHAIHVDHTIRRRREQQHRRRRDLIINLNLSLNHSHQSPTTTPAVIAPDVRSKRPSELKDLGPPTCTNFHSSASRFKMKWVIGPSLAVPSNSNVAVRSATPEDAAAYDGTNASYDPPEYSVSPSSDNPIWVTSAVIKSITSSTKAIRVLLVRVFQVARAVRPHPQRRLTTTSWSQYECWCRCRRDRLCRSRRQLRSPLRRRCSRCSPRR